MNPAEERRQIALLGQRVEIARPGQRLTHVVAGGRADRADGDERRAARAEEQRGRVSQRRLRRREAGQRPERHDLRQRHHKRWRSRSS